MNSRKQRIIGTQWSDAKGIEWQVTELEMPNLYRIVGKRDGRVIRVGSMQANAIRKLIEDRNRKSSDANTNGQ